MTTLVAADQFCGGGGTSTGLALACRERSIAPKLYALNHWPIALETHRRNHPWAVHISEEMEQIDPLEVVPEGYLDLLVSSPTCTFFSIARGGKPTGDQQRSQPYEVVKWIDQLHPNAILVENVPEFQLWGPVAPSGTPDPMRKGLCFRRWTSRIRNLGYNVDWRVLNAADYGGATSRRRFFLIAKPGETPVSWPVPTHAPRVRPVPGRETWRAAAEVLDWALVGESIWTRTRPLSYATWRRIVVGLERYGGAEVQPFVRILKKTTGLDDLKQQPRKGGPTFILPALGRTGKNAPRSVEEPLHTIVGGKPSNGQIVQPYVIRRNSNREKTQGRIGAAPRSTEDPPPTVVALSQGTALTEPFLVPVVGRRASDHVDPKSVRDPFSAFTSRTSLWLTNAVIIPRHGERRGQAPRAHSVEAPLPTIPATGEPMLARGFLVKYYGNDWTGRDSTQPLDEPLPSPTTKDRCLLVRPVVIDGKFLDIRIRMIQPHELSAGMGFPKSYEFAGNRGEVVRQIGNAVEVNIARALCAALLAPRSRTLTDFAA